MERKMNKFWALGLGLIIGLFTLYSCDKSTVIHIHTSELDSINQITQVIDSLTSNDESTHNVAEEPDWFNKAEATADRVFKLVFMFVTILFFLLAMGFVIWAVADMIIQFNKEDKG